MKYILGVCLCMIGYAAGSHPVSLSWVTGKIKDNKIILSYKILAEDLIYFHQPAHDEHYDFDLNTLRALTQKHGELITKYFRIESGDGQNLEPKISSINARSLIGEKVNVMDLMKLEIYYRFEYQLSAAGWEELSFYQNIGSHKIAIPSITVLSVFENGEALIDNMELAIERPITIRKGEVQKPMRPSEFTSSFFTLSQAGIRHELTIPVTTFNALLAQTQAGDAPFADKVMAYFMKRNPIFSNDYKLTPQLANFTSLTNKLDGNGFMYIDILYPTGQYPEHTTITWQDYNWQFKWFNSSIMAMDSVYKHTFSRFQPLIKINSELKIEVEKE